jgi:glycosyltransferase involved in cell wall biosynthesis
MSRVLNMKTVQNSSENFHGQDIEELKVAWLLPSVKAGAHWQPVLTRFLGNFKRTIFFTTDVWKEFDYGASYAKAFCQLGNLKTVLVNKESIGYNHGLLVLPFSIISHLSRFRPHIIIANAFSVWTLIAVFMKPLFRWKVIILYEGSTPNSDFQNSRVRSVIRKLISHSASLFVANTISAKHYLCTALGVPEEQVLSGHYLLPDVALLSTTVHQSELDLSVLKKPIFLYVGQIVARKGIFQLLEACSSLKAKGLNDYSLLIIGDGIEKERFEAEVHQRQLQDQIICLGRVDYGGLGTYFKVSDVFMFPTCEDTWGMAALEALAFGKPVICSKHSGASELIIHGENGYLIEPKLPENIASSMEKLISNPSLVHQMTIRTAATRNHLNADNAIDTLAEAIQLALKSE